MRQVWPKDRAVKNNHSGNQDRATLYDEVQRTNQLS